MRYKSIRTRLKLDKTDHRFLRVLMHASKSLYNQALYNVRQHFFETGKYLSYEENYHLLKISEHYRLLNTSQAQAVIRKVDEAMKAFFGSLKSSNSVKVRLPKYLQKNGYYPLIDRMVYKPHKDYYILPRGNFIKHTSNLFKLQKKEQRILDNLNFSNIFKKLHIRIDTPQCIQQYTIKEITIKPLFDGQYIEVIHVYEVEDNNKKEERKSNTETMGIDFGYNNLATCAVTNGHHLLLDGKKLKSFNQWYHKQMAHLRSTRPNQHRTTKRMMALELKRRNQMTYGINKAARIIINHALEHNVKDIVIGWNDNFKEQDKGKKTNQWFKSIPLAKLRDRIIYLCKEYHINCMIVTEEYTSKASYLDNDELPREFSRSHVFSGKRVKRGLYISKKGTIINADVNAALNILYKGKPEAKRLGASGVNTPKRTLLF